MWYLSWVLGVGLVLGFSIVYVKWMEAEYFCKIELEEAKAGNFA